MDGIRNDRAKGVGGNVPYTNNTHDTKAMLGAVYNEWQCRRR